MTESVILTHVPTAILSAVAFFAMIIAYLISNKKIAAVVQVASFLCVLAVITWALLLGAELTEILILILIFVLISAFSFIPKRENPESKQTEENKKNTEEKNSGEDGNEL